MEEITCRVCGRVEEIVEKDDDDYVCSVCCKLSITDRKELQNYLKAKAEKPSKRFIE